MSAPDAREPMKGKVAELWRYPVSSMAGEQLAVARVEPGGIAGDRIWGVLDEATGRIASPGREKHFIGVPRAHARIADGGVAVSVDGRSWAGRKTPRCGKPCRRPSASSRY